MMNSTAALQVNLAGRARAASGRSGSPGPTGSARPWWRSRPARPGCTAATPAGSRPGSGPGAGWTRGRAARCRAALRRTGRRRGARSRPRPGPGTRCAPRSRSCRRRATTSWPCGRSVPFEQWASGAVRLGSRPPTAADLETHLTTLFPPVRLRGYLELRYLDMTAPRWWPAIAAVAATLMDDPVAADQATEATEPDRAAVDRGGPGRAGQRRAGRLGPPLRGDRRRPGARPSSARPSPTWPSSSSRADVRATCWPSASARSARSPRFEELAHA